MSQSLSSEWLNREGAQDITLFAFRDSRFAIRFGIRGFRDSRIQGFRDWRFGISIGIRIVASIVIVEDDPDISDLIAHYLQKAGHEVTRLTTGTRSCHDFGRRFLIS